MIPAKSILRLLKENDFKFFSGVPCSILEKFLNAVFADRGVRYIPAVRENIALGIASGAYLAGKKGAIFIQNSGLGNMINALTSFNLIYKIPVLMFITWRGYRGKDAPEHLVMGEKTISLLKLLGIPMVVLSADYKRDISRAIRLMDKRSVPTAVIIKNGMI